MHLSSILRRCYSSTLLLYYATVLLLLLDYSTIMLLYYCCTVLLYCYTYYTKVLLHYYRTRLYGYETVRLYYYTTALHTKPLYYCTTKLFYYYPTVLQYYHITTTTTLQHCYALRLQHGRITPPTRSHTPLRPFVPLPHVRRAQASTLRAGGLPTERRGRRIGTCMGQGVATNRVGMVHGSWAISCMLHQSRINNA